VQELKCEVSFLHQWLQKEDLENNFFQTSFHCFQTSFQTSFT